MHTDSSEVKKRKGHFLCLPVIWEGAGKVFCELALPVTSSNFFLIPLMPYKNSVYQLPVVVQIST